MLSERLCLVFTKNVCEAVRRQFGPSFENCVKRLAYVIGVRRIRNLQDHKRLYRIDVILSDGPVGANARVRAFSHLLGESSMSVFGTPAVARKLRRRFPESLQGAPFLLPHEAAPTRRSLEEWFRRHGIVPRIVAEIGDSALISVFAGRGLGLFAAPTVVEDEVRRQYGVAVVGRTDEVVERYYLISGERRLRNPAVVRLSDEAREHLFAR